MKKQLALIGFSSFNRRILEQLEDSDCEILLVDKDPEIVDTYKDRVYKAFIADVLNEDSLSKLIPVDIDAVLVDPGDRIEVSILVTNYLKKMGVAKVFVRADTDEHGEILSLVGADHVVFPNREAAMRLAPMLLSSHLLSYMPLSKEMVLAEVKAPALIVGKKLMDSGIRDNLNLNVVGLRGTSADPGYIFAEPDHVFQEDDILLIAGAEKKVSDFSNGTLLVKEAKLNSLLKGFFSRK